MLLEVATAPDEPGALYLSYMTTLRVTHAALSNLIRLCSAPSSESATPLVHGTPNNLVPGAKRHLDEADAIGRKTMEHGAARGPPPQPRPPEWAVESMRGMAGEAATRLRALCAGPVSLNASPRLWICRFEATKMRWGQESNGARRAALEMIEGAAFALFELPGVEEPSPYLRHPPL